MSLPQAVEMSHLILKRFVTPGDFALDATCGNGHDTVFLARLVGVQGQVLAVDIQEKAVSETRRLLAEKNLSRRAKVMRGDHSKLKELLKENLPDPPDPDIIENKNHSNEGKNRESEKYVNKRINERVYNRVYNNDQDNNTQERAEKNNINKEKDNKNNLTNNIAKKAEKDSAEAEERIIKAAVFNLGFLPGSDKEVITTAKTTIPALKQSLELIKSGGVLVIVAYTGHQGGQEECQQILDWAERLNYNDYNVLHKKFINQPTNPPQVIAVEKRT